MGGTRVFMKLGLFSSSVGVQHVIPCGYLCVCVCVRVYQCWLGACVNVSANHTEDVRGNFEAGDGWSNSRCSHEDKQAQGECSCLSSVTQ